MASDDMRKQDDFRMSSSCMVSLIRFQIFLECFTRFYCLEWFITHFFLSVMLSKDHEGIWSYTNSSRVESPTVKSEMLLLRHGSWIPPAFFFIFQAAPQINATYDLKGGFLKYLTPMSGTSKMLLSWTTRFACRSYDRSSDCSRDGMQNAGCTTVPFPDNECSFVICVGCIIDLA